MGAIEVHRAVYAHLPEMTDLWVAAWTEAMPEIDFEARRAWFVERIGGYLTGDVAVHAAFDTRNGTMAGFMTLAPDGEINQLAVAPGYWGSTAAQKLIAFAKQAGHAQLCLTVNQANTRAVRFYEREGFVRTAEGINPNSGLPIWSYVWTKGA